MEEKLLTAQDLKKITGLNISTIYRLTRNGKLSCFRFGRSYRYKPDDFLESFKQ